MGQSSSSRDSSLARSRPAIPHGLAHPSHSLCTLTVQGDRHRPLGIWLSSAWMALPLQLTTASSFLSLTLAGN